MFFAEMTLLFLSIALAGGYVWRKNSGPIWCIGSYTCLGGAMLCGLWDILVRLRAGDIGGVQDIYDPTFFRLYLFLLVLVTLLCLAAAVRKARKE